MVIGRKKRLPPQWQFVRYHVWLAILIIGLNMLTLLHNIDYRLEYLQHRLATIENLHNAVIIKLDEDSESELRDIAPIQFSSKPEAWRPLHAQLIRKLIAAEARIIVFDFSFNRTDTTLDNDFLDALEIAKREGVAVILSFSEKIPDHPFYSKAFKGISHAALEEGNNVTKCLLLFDEPFNHQGKAYPSLTAQAWSLWHSFSQEEAMVEDEVLICPDRTIRQKHLWLRYARQPFREYRYSDVILWRVEELDDIRGKAVFVGAALNDDLHAVPVISPGQPGRSDDESSFVKTFGVYLHAHAFNQLEANVFAREISYGNKLAVCLALGGLFALYSIFRKFMHRSSWLVSAFTILLLVLLGFFVFEILTPFATIFFSGTISILLMLKRKEFAMKRVFIVHGRDEELRLATENWIKDIGLQAIILSEQTNQGRTILEKFEENSDVSFAIILLTHDDIGFLAEDKQDSSKWQPRARQNVIFEFGFFLGKLGRDKVCVLYKPDPIDKQALEMPSDAFGFTHIEADAGGGWKTSLGRELKKARLPIDLNRGK